MDTVQPHISQIQATQRYCCASSLVHQLARHPHAIPTFPRSLSPSPPALEHTQPNNALLSLCPLLLSAHNTQTKHNTNQASFHSPDDEPFIGSLLGDNPSGASFEAAIEGEPLGAPCKIGDFLSLRLGEPGIVAGILLGERPSGACLLASPE